MWEVIYIYIVVCCSYRFGRRGGEGEREGAYGVRGTSVVYEQLGRVEGASPAKEGGGVHAAEEGGAVAAGEGGAVVAPVEGGSGAEGVSEEKIYRGLNRALREQGMIPADRVANALCRGGEQECSNGSIDSSFTGSKDEVNSPENGLYESMSGYDEVCNN